MMMMTNAVGSKPRAARVNLPTGVRLRYVEQGDPAGEPLIFLHGYTDSSYSFSRVLPLVGDAFHVYAIDQRGHGDSERPRRGYALRDFASDVLAFMDVLGLGRATVVGHCMGSLVAQRVALNEPARVAGLVLVSSMTCASRIEGAAELQQAVEALGETVPAEFAREFQEGTVYGRVPEEFMDRVVAESLKVPARVWRATLAGLLEDGHASRLDRILTPTLLIWGNRDALLARPEQDALAGALANARLVVYPETGHSPHWERPERFVRDLEDFVNTL